MRANHEHEPTVVEELEDAVEEAAGYLGIGEAGASGPDAIDHEMGPFKAPESVRVSGIVEQSGYVPWWVVWSIIGAIVLGLLAWIPLSGY